jgi:hypothetical protein
MPADTVTITLRRAATTEGNILMTWAVREENKTGTTRRRRKRTLTTIVVTLIQ